MVRAERGCPVGGLGVGEGVQRLVGAPVVGAVGLHVAEEAEVAHAHGPGDRPLVDGRHADAAVVRVQGRDTADRQQLAHEGHPRVRIYAL